MSNKTDTPQQQPEEVTEVAQPVKVATIAEDLEQKGTVVLHASTIEALSELLNSIPAEFRYRTGAVGRKREDGSYTLRIDKITKPVKTE